MVLSPNYFYKFLISMQKRNRFQTSMYDVIALLIVSYLKHGLKTNSMSITCECVRILKSQATLETESEFSEGLQEIHMHNKIWEAEIYSFLNRKQADRNVYTCIAD